MTQPINSCGHPERKPRAKGKCNSCYQKDWQREWRRKYPEKDKAKADRWRAKNPEKIRQYNIQNRGNRKIARIELTRLVIGHYGGQCTCCGESERAFLTIDHVNNDGAEHKRIIGSNLYRWLKKQGYPDDFQVLCWNCNSGRARNGGVCPHAEEKVAEAA